LPGAASPWPEREVPSHFPLFPPPKAEKKEHGKALPCGADVARILVDTRNTCEYLSILFWMKRWGFQKGMICEGKGAIESL
jgi:hypothetical protein